MSALRNALSFLALVFVLAGCGSSSNSPPTPPPLVKGLVEFTLPHVTGTSRIFANAIIPGPDGALWFTGDDEDSQTAFIGRITTTGMITEFPLHTKGGAAAIVAGADGALWFTEWTSNRIGRITPGALTEFALPTANSHPGGITAGPDGALWFVENTDPDHYISAIGRITPGGAITVFPQLDSLNEFGMLTIATGPDGNLWVGRYGGVIERFTLSGSTASFPVALPGDVRAQGITAITVGPDGNLWWALSSLDDGFFDGAIGCITPSGALSLFSLPERQIPVGMTIGPDGNLWFTLDGGKIGHITPRQ